MSDRATAEETVTRTETEMSHRFKLAQDNDESLDCYRTRASCGSSEYVFQNGLLYKRAGPGAAETDLAYVLVVPKTHETEVIKTAHSSVFGGHLGVRKTVQRISSEFFIPRLKQKVNGLNGRIGPFWRC